ncbi:MAG: hypothetical protein QXQ79_00045 [Candidatus Nanoarchaeia archaeon]
MVGETYPMHSFKKDIKIEKQELENLKTAFHNAIYHQRSFYETLKKESEAVLLMLHYYSVLERAISELEEYEAFLYLEEDPVKAKEFINKIASNYPALLKYIDKYEKFMQQIIELKPSFDHLIEVLKIDLQRAKSVEAALREVFKRFEYLFEKKGNIF